MNWTKPFLDEEKKMIKFKLWVLEWGENELKKLDSDMQFEHFKESLEEHSGSQRLGSEL